MLSRTLLLCLLTFGSLFSAVAQSSHSLLIESAGKSETYTLDGAAVPLRKLLDLAGEIVSKDPQSSIAIIFDGSVSLDIAENAQGIFSKAGFQKTTLFVRSKKTGKMSEVSFGMPVPFTLNPQ